MLRYWRVLEAIAAQHRGALVIGAAAAFTILVLLWTNASRTRYVILRPSNESESIVLQLHRIAAALERIAARDEVPNFTSDQILREANVDTVESPPPLQPEPAPAPAFRPTQAGVGSMFSFGRRELPNALFRPK